MGATGHVAQMISAALAPALVLNGLGLLLAGLQAKYSTLVNVIREMTGELRGCGLEKQERAGILRRQIGTLLVRSQLLRNAILCLYAAAIGVLLACVVMGLAALDPAFAPWALGVFGCALGGLVLGLCFALREAWMSYRIVQIEFESAPRT